MKTATKEINWNLTKDERYVISKIAKRACDLAAKNGDEYAVIDAAMDVTACHLNGCSLDLDKLLHANDFDFIHDMSGIYLNLNRTTGALRNFFLPRCAKRS